MKEDLSPTIKEPITVTTINSLDDIMKIQEQLINEIQMKLFALHLFQNKEQSGEIDIPTNLTQDTFFLKLNLRIDILSRFNEKLERINSHLNTIV
jgi:uncharacterized protein YigA (DUF484 family)